MFQKLRCLFESDLFEKILLISSYIHLFVVVLAFVYIKSLNDREIFIGFSIKWCIFEIFIISFIIFYDIITWEKQCNSGYYLKDL